MAVTKLSKSSVLRALSKVPAFPPIAAKLLGLLAREPVDLGRVADLVRGDPMLSARVLQCVNSVEFGRAHEIKDIRSALAFLGLDRTRQITVTLATQGYAKAALGAAELRRCWEHTLATAVLADEIASACGLFSGVAYTAGIIHDIGRLGLLVAYPREYECVIRDAAERCVDLLDFEFEQFGVHHAEAGRILSERWGLPDEFRIVAGRHHDRPEAAELDLLGIVQAACQMADILGFYVTRPLVTQRIEDALALLPSPAREQFERSPEELHSRITERIASFERMDNGGPASAGTDLPFTSEIPESPPEVYEPPPELRYSGRAQIVLGIIAALISIYLIWRSW
ncbi:MAG: HDOD domain-containing protein [Bryobacteraceae bacterium]